MSEEEEILGAFLLVNDYRILTNEELEDVKKAINNLQQENVKFKQQLKDKDEKISKIEKLTKQLKGSARYQRCMDELDYILNINKED